MGKFRVGSLRAKTPTNARKLFRPISEPFGERAANETALSLLVLVGRSVVNYKRTFTVDGKSGAESELHPPTKINLLPLAGALRKSHEKGRSVERACSGRN